MALRLSRDDHRFEREQVVDEGGVDRSYPLAGGVLGDLGVENRVVLGEGILAFHLHPRRRLPGDRVEEDRLLDDRDEGVAGTADHRVVGPHDQGVLAAFVEPPHVVSGPGRTSNPGRGATAAATCGFTRQRPASMPSRDKTVWGEGWSPAASTQNTGWKIWTAVWVSQRDDHLGDLREVAIEKGCNADEPSTAPRPERPPTKSSYPGTQKVF